MLEHEQKESSQVALPEKALESSYSANPVLLLENEKLIDVVWRESKA